MEIPYQSIPGIPIGAPGGISTAGSITNLPASFPNSPICSNPSNSAPFHFPVAPAT